MTLGPGPNSPPSRETGDLGVRPAGPPIGRPAWGWRPWPAGGDGEKVAISRGSKILTMLNDARDWLDLEGAHGVDVTMASDLGVFGEDCEAMMVISVEERKDVMKTSGRLEDEQMGEAFRFKSRLLTPNTREWNV